MINQIIAFLLDKIIGKYVDNFSSQNVRTGFFKGDIQLDNLPLKQTVLQDLFEWPIIVKSGLIGRVTLRIPYTRLRTQAWAIMIEDIYIIAKPNDDWKFNEKTFQNENLMKKLILDSLEAKWRKKVQNQNESEKSESGIWLSYAASLGYRILRNIQVEIKNLHFRYEDHMTIPSKMFSIGLLIDEFSTKSSDFEWESKGELKTDTDIVNKRIDLQGVRIYLDPVCKCISEEVSLENINSLLQQEINNMPDSNYIIKPISLCGLMKRNINPLPMHKKPRICLKLQMELVQVSLSQAQYKTIVAIGEEIERFDRHRHHMKYRPKVSVMEGPRQWWKFAISEYMRDACRVETLVERARNLVKYVNSYEDYLLNKDDLNRASFRNQMEFDLDFESLIHLREVAMQRASLKSRDLIQKDVNTQPSQTGWWDYLLGRRSKNVPSNVIPQSAATNSETLQILEQILPEELKSTEQNFQQDLQDIINEVDSEAVNFFTRDKIFLRGQFSLDGIKLFLLKETTTQIVEMNASELKIGFESQPLYSSWCIRIGLRSLFIKDLSPTKCDPFCDVVSSVVSKRDGDEVFSLIFETNPPNNLSVNRILVIKSKPLNILHCPTLIENLKEYFFNLSTEKDIKAMAKRRIKDAQVRTTESIRNMLDKGSSAVRWWISLQISAPKIILPNHRQIKSENPNFLLFDFGCLRVANCKDQEIEYLENKFTSESYEDESDIEDYVTPASSLSGSLDNIPLCSSMDEDSTEIRVDMDIYDNYSITLYNVMIVVGNWEELQITLSKNSYKTKNLSLVKSFTLQLNVKRKCTVKKSREFPNLILTSRLAELEICISDNKIKSAKGCLESLSCFISHQKKADLPPIKSKKISRMEGASMKNNNFKSAEINFILESLIIQLESQNRPLAELSLKKAQFQFDRYPYTTMINVKLMNIVLADARANLGPELDFIVASHKVLQNEKFNDQHPDEPIITISYEISSCPRSPYSQHKINLIFSELDIIANQETLMELLSFMRLITSSNVDQQNITKVEPSNFMKIESLDVSIICKAVNVLLIKILPTTDTENRYAEPIGKILLSQMSLNVCKKGPLINSKIMVCSVNIEDISTLDSVHKNILTLITETTEGYSNSENEESINISLTQDEDSGLFKISGTMPHIIYVHSPQFIHSIEKCISEFQIYFDLFKNNLANAAQTAFLANKNGKGTSFFKNAKVSIKMLSPILVLPRLKSSDQIIVINLGNIELCNEGNCFHVILTEATVISKKLLIQNKSYDIRMCTENNSKFPIVNKINLHLKIYRQNDAEKIIIECDCLSSLTVSFSKAIYEQLLKTTDNLVFDDDEDILTTSCYNKMSEDNQVNTLPHMDIPIAFISKLTQIEVLLYTDSLVDCEQPMFNILIKEISFEFLRKSKFIKDIELSLDQIFMYQILDFNHDRIQKILISSFASNDPARRKSKSCSDITMELDDYYPFQSSSFVNNHYFLYAGAKRKRSFSNSEEMVCLPPKKAKNLVKNPKSHRLEKLARIQVRLIDKKIPQFSTEYKSINRVINANFNELRFHIKMEAWVYFLDFFGLGSRFYDPDDIQGLDDVSKVPATINKRYDGEVEEIISTQLRIHFNKFSLVLENERQYKDHLNLSEIICIDFDLKSLTQDGNLTLSGSLSDFELRDLSPTGSVYDQRLFPASNQHRILKFNVFKYGLPDPCFLRKEDIILDVKISAPIVYIHTQRFLQELSQFFQNFMQYQDRLSHIRVTSAGKKVNNAAQRASRIRMQISCQAPLLLLPVSAFSDRILVVDLGQFSLKNEFTFDKSNNIFPCLLDKMKIDLSDMDVYSAIRIHDTSNVLSNDIKFSNFIIRPILPKPLSKKCFLYLTVCRNLNCNTSHACPDWQIDGDLSSVIFHLNIDHYQTIRGVLSHNLGENVDHLKSYKFQAFETDPNLHTELTGIPWLAMKFELRLNDVQLNLLSQFENFSDEIICKFNFCESKLIYESNSDSSKAIELVCQEITVEDLRYMSCPANNKLNVFQTIMCPDVICMIKMDESNPCQLRIRYGSNNDRNKVMIDVDKMKTTVIFDWLLITKNWISTPPYEIVSLYKGDEKRLEEFSSYYVQSKPSSEENSGRPHDILHQYKKLTHEEFKPTEYIVNFEESRFFVLQDSSSFSTNALMLKIAGRLCYNSRENRLGPFTVNISQFHLASCNMSDTSHLLSIINPVQILVESKEGLSVNHEKPSLSDVLHDKNNTTLDVNIAVSAFKIRLSFCDIQLLIKIVESFRNQTIPPANVAFQTGNLKNRWSTCSIEGKSLARSNQSFSLKKISKFVSKISIEHFGTDKIISICLIDDCIDADVPLFDIKLYHSVVLYQSDPVPGNFSALLSVDYYDTNSFTWTSVIDPWSFEIKLENSRKMTIQSKETLNVDISNYLIQITKNTYKKWSTEFRNPDKIVKGCRETHNVFVPFIIVNELGCPLRYRKFSSTNPPMYDELCNISLQSQSWIEIPDSKPVNLFFDMETTARDKILYDSVGTPFHTSNRIELSLIGWQKSLPITVDKLGIFYRDLLREKSCNDNFTRIVIEIVRQGSVQNKIIIRSSLQICNTLNVPLEIKFSEKYTPLKCLSKFPIGANTTVAVPLLYVNHNIKIKPSSNAGNETPTSPVAKNCLFYTPLRFCENLRHWDSSEYYDQKMEYELHCPLKGFNPSIDKSNQGAYLICAMERLCFPLTPKLPGHLIKISAPFSIENRLPCDLKFFAETKLDDKPQHITNEALVRPSHKCTVLTTHMCLLTLFSVYLDSFPRCDPLQIYGDVKLSHTVLIKLYDEEDRLLELVVKVESRPYGPVSVIVLSQYWILNRTSLPLLYAQTGGTDMLAAGHVPENDEACSTMPFLFNFSNKNESFTLCIRLGSKSQYVNNYDFKPLWSDGIPLEEGVTTIQLRMRSLDLRRPHLLFNIGLEIRRGKGIHECTKMVILTARYLLDNRTSHPLYFQQYDCKDDKNQPIMALPGSFLTFHWPRDDRDQLLTVSKLDLNKEVISQISGGFRLDLCKSFHIYLRGVNNHPPCQLRISISLQGAQYRVVFTDADNLPSPYKLENFTDLQVIFYQEIPDSVCQNGPKHSALSPQNSVLYALDEPIYPPIINLRIEGGTQACYNLNAVGGGQDLEYDNFIYITINNSTESDSEDFLVFDVPSKTRNVILNSKCSMSRSQLWFYSSDGKLFHEGSIAPHNPKQKLDRSSENHLLLDVDILAPCPSDRRKQIYRMILAKADSRRDKYQMWSFTNEGYLVNKIGMKCYIKSSCRNAPIYGGFVNPGGYFSPKIIKDSCRPGSGKVAVSILTDGPSRVLRLEDKSGVMKRTSEDNCLQSSIKVDLHGFGIFLINHIPEEVLHISLNNIFITWDRKCKKDNVLINIRKVQVDNQQMKTEFPCVIYEEFKEATHSPQSYLHMRKRSWGDEMMSDDTGETGEENAFCLHFEREFGHKYDINIFSFIKVKVVPICVVLEEKMLLKVIQMYKSLYNDSDLMEEYLNNNKLQFPYHEGKMVYIGNLQLHTGTISLSVITSDSLPPDLKKMKRILPSLTSFTNAQINIDAFERRYVFETTDLICQNITNHYRKQLKSQAIKIFGTVDFLGNPIGFISDITTGMKKFYEDQDIFNMVRHFAHGIGDSTAKICNSFAKVVSEMTMDPEYEEKRHELLESGRVSSSKTAQVKVGLQSFAYGLMGGIKSVPNQINKGYKKEGPSGVFVGALKGLVGVVAKPTGGLLDFATGSATTFREIARSSQTTRPPRQYEPRQCSSSSKLLPHRKKSISHSKSDLNEPQDFLLKKSHSQVSAESVIGTVTIQNFKDFQMKVIVSDASVHIISIKNKNSNLIKHFPFEKFSIPPVIFCREKQRFECCVLISFNIESERSKYKCDSEDVARKLIKLVCEAYSDYLERQMVLKN